MKEDYIRKSCEPKSDQLNADDLVSGPRVFTITGVKRGDAQQPVWVELAEAKPYKPSKGMRRVMVSAWGEHPKDWVGNKVELYRDDNVMFGGVRVGGIRIAAMTGIQKDLSFLVTMSKGKRAEYKVKKIEPLNPDDAKLVDELSKSIEAADTTEALDKIGASLSGKSTAVKDAVRPLFARKKSAFSFTRS